MAGVPSEIELKLAIAPEGGAAEVAAVVVRLLRHPALAAAKHGRARTARVVSTYFDTPDWRLSADGIALRVRSDGGRWWQTVKGPPLADAGGALHARSEYEWPLPGNALDTARLATTPWRRRLGRALAGGKLAPRYVTDFERRNIPLAFADGTRATLCVDVGAIRASTTTGRRAAARRTGAPIAEIEIELVSGDVARLFELAQALAADLPLTVATANKASRGAALAQGRPDGWRRPVRAQHLALAANVDAADALRSIALECLQHVAANAPGLLADDDPEWVHQMRVGTRRLRSCLGLAAPFVDAERLAPVLAEIKWLAETLGTARDWDVFVTETLPAAAASLPPSAAGAASLRRLRARAGRRRRAARAAARAAVRSSRFAGLLLAVGALCATAGFARPASRSTRANDAPPPRATRFARRLLRRRHRRLVKRAPAAMAGGAEQRHALRIAAKKLRYAAEFFAPLCDGDAARAYVGALAEVQTVLGRGNDAATAARLIALLEGTGTSDDSDAAGALRAWIEARSGTTDAELVRAWEAFAATRRFWRGR